MESAGFRTAAESEMVAARAARAAGYEGRARVCARRAAAAAIAAYLRSNSTNCQPRGAIHLLQILAAHSAQPEAVRLAARRLTVPVTPEHTLPHAEDPLEDAEIILRALT